MTGRIVWVKLPQTLSLRAGVGEEEIRCSYDDSSLEQYLLLILRYDCPKTSITGACLLFSSNVHKAGSQAARHVDAFLPQRTPALLLRLKLLYCSHPRSSTSPWLPSQAGFKDHGAPRHPSACTQQTRRSTRRRLDRCPFRHRFPRQPANTPLGGQS